MKWREEVCDQDKVSRPQEEVRRITRVVGQVFSTIFSRCQVNSRLVTILTCFPSSDFF